MGLLVNVQARQANDRASRIIHHKSHFTRHMSRARTGKRVEGVALRLQPPLLLRRPHALR
jgi:hypothetical protein